jgi:putative SOS response-associated peptidase YedK
MCGRYAATLPPEMMVELFKLLNRIDYPPRYNIAPTQPIAVIWEQEARRTVQLVRWGFVPGWVKDPREFPLLINARAEGLIEKPSFRDAIKRNRCVIPASGYFEWMKGEDGKKRPYYITLEDDEVMAFAGVYSNWIGPHWLNTRDVTAKQAVQLASPPPPGAMTYYPVGKAIGSALAEGPDLIRPLTAEELAAEDAERPTRRKKVASGQGELF